MSICMRLPHLRVRVFLDSAYPVSFVDSEGLTRVLPGPIPFPVPPPPNISKPKQLGDPGWDPFTDTTPTVTTPTPFPYTEPGDCEKRYEEDRENCKWSCGDGSIGAQAKCYIMAWLNRMLKKSEALEKPMSTRPKMAENYLVKLLFGLILTRFVDSGI
ncbi:MAG: hypothetical protein FWF12_12000 [Betaproteobacteria bacterium]|nr:hypothetical protein [Betaproteobacteria bacterium]